MADDKTIIANGVKVDRAKLLAALVNASLPQGLGFLRPESGRLMTLAAAENVLAEHGGLFNFDYVWGKPIKTHEHNGEIDGRLYDRDAGRGAFDEAVRRAAEG